jgi:hypothetical protein
MDLGCGDGSFTVPAMDIYRFIPMDYRYHKKWELKIRKSKLCWGEQKGYRHRVLT